MMMMVITSILIFQAPCSEARAGARRLHFEAAVEKVFLEARKAAVCPNPTRGSARKSKYRVIHNDGPKNLLIAPEI